MFFKNLLQSYNIIVTILNESIYSISGIVESGNACIFIIIYEYIIYISNKTWTI